MVVDLFISLSFPELWFWSILFYCKSPIVLLMNIIGAKSLLRHDTLVTIHGTMTTIATWPQVETNEHLVNTAGWYTMVSLVSEGQLTANFLCFMSIYPGWSDIKINPGQQNNTKYSFYEVSKQGRWCLPFCWLALPWVGGVKADMPSLT